MRKLLMNKHNSNSVPAIMFLSEKDAEDISRMMRRPGKIVPHTPSKYVDYRSIVEECREVEIILNSPELRTMQQQIIDLQRDLDYEVYCRMAELGDSIYKDFADYVNGGTKNDI